MNFLHPEYPMTRSLRLGVLLAMLALALPRPGAAQTLIYFNAGATLTTLGGSDAPSLDSRVGIVAGGGLLIDVTEALQLQAGISYIQKGAVLPDPDFDYTIAIDYLEMPVLLRYPIATGGRFTPHLMLGPAVSFKLGCSINASSQGSSASIPCGEGIIPPVQSVDIGGMGGAGVTMATSGRVAFALDVLYNVGFVTIDDSPASDDVKNRAWSFVGGVTVPLN